MESMGSHAILNKDGSPTGTGLTAEEAQKRLTQDGYNELEKEEVNHSLSMLYAFTIFNLVKNTSTQVLS
jgi:hypothetical protein